METIGTIPMKDRELLAAIRGLLTGILELEEVDALLTPLRLPQRGRIMPVLVGDPKQLETADPLAPVFPLNAARMVCRLSRKPPGGKIVVVMRPCEIRAFIELVKLKQGSMDPVIIVGIDCLGAFANRDLNRFREGADVAGDPDSATRAFCETVLSGKPRADDEPQLQSACRSCIQPTPAGADLAIDLLGEGDAARLTVRGQTEKGATLLGKLGLDAGDAPAGRDGAVEAFVAGRQAYREKSLAATREAVDTLPKLATWFADCINCYNCRSACPVCYCRECVFSTDQFEYEPSRYLGWVRRKGALKMPTDTVFYHLTRLAHMSTACVGCGQCSNSCPNDIPVMEVFQVVAENTQGAFDYEAGRDVDEAPPLSEFKEDEYQEVVG